MSQLCHQQIINQSHSYCTTQQDITEKRQNRLIVTVHDDDESREERFASQHSKAVHFDELNIKVFIGARQWFVIERFTSLRPAMIQILIEP